MVDTRFHQFAGARTLSSLLAAIELAAELDGDGPLIEGVEELHLAGPGHVALAAHPEYRSALQATGAGVVIVSNDLAEDVPPGVVRVVARDPHMAFVGLIEQLYPQNTRGSVMALLGPYDTLPYTENDVRIGPGVVLGPGVEIGRGTVIGPNTVIGAGVTIGRNATIGSNCSIECAHLGNGVVLHAGARIGSEGFGWLDHGRSNRKIPQLGRVIVQDRVEIGANTTIDRGALGDTVIGEGTKIDNLVQIGHNCRIGRNCLLAGMAGLAGSTVLEDSVMIGAAAITTGHLTIGAGSIVLARSVVTKDVKRGGRVGGYPAQDVRDWRRETATLRMMNKGNKSGREN
ncbi:MAG: UDP-3-O-(3-hydroxymyristoyl)glucosamine N-acyltransferase [Devosia sp.]|uniref:UDP-3-O-(3-hydroxymyristoyl)glucosamine N-acyltransferase n=1 Tax=Devosia sp. TaxID=1871048 RepID=UPI001A41D82A|nr:UDP-3-O-(3-hydroxymyristoyl)glucosamine N-acyltransferase [Devosia sp.]MBL8596141.1 UDP-3-O-(3-hydroxymyristoyl)glucosamine N-acyltransferase [Devosia sp.]